MKIKLKHGEDRRLSVRDIAGIFVLCAVFVFVGYDKNFIEAAGPVKIFEKPKRELKIKVVLDPAFLVLSGSSEKAALEIVQTISGASEIFERHFGIKFVICDVASWDDGADSVSFMKFREEVANKPCDAVVLFSGRNINGEEDVLGAAFGSKIILRARKLNYASERGQARILAHEIGHLFCAGLIKHAQNGLMREYDANLAKEEWDELSWRIIILNKYKNFHKYGFLPKKLRP